MKPFLAIILFSIVLVGCQSSPGLTLTVTSQASQTPLLTATQRPTQTDAPTMVPIATLNAEATLDAYKDLCKADYPAYSVEQYPIWANGEWLAIGCESDRNLDLIVQNQGGLKWELHFADFLNPDLGDFERSGLWLMAWSRDGRFLYFTKSLSWSGGSDSQCFAGLGVYGLYRLHLNTGEVVTLVPTDDINGKQIRFSPTTEYYAVDSNGVTITNLVNGDITNIDVHGVMEMNWSPDGRYLAFSIASCGEDLVESSSILVWDSSTKQSRVLFSSEDMLLRPRSWTDSSLLKFEGEKRVGYDNVYTVFEYDLGNDEMIFSATATPRP